MTMTDTKYIVPDTEDQGVKSQQNTVQPALSSDEKKIFSFWYILNKNVLKLFSNIIF